MEFLGIGPLELLFIFLIAIIVLGPTDMVKAGRTMGRFLRNIVTSPTWKTMVETSRGLRYLPNKLIREAGLEEEMKDLGQIRKDLGQLRTDLRPAGLMGEEPAVKPGTSQADEPPSIAPAGDFSSWTTPVTIPSPPPPPSPEPPASAPAPDAAAPDETPTP
jgi:hypothetical protein